MLRYQVLIPIFSFCFGILLSKRLDDFGTPIQLVIQKVRMLFYLKFYTTIEFAFGKAETNSRGGRSFY